jgi:hypothetical protein
MAERLPVWPPIREILRSRFKHNVIVDLDHIAERITRTARPRTSLLSDELMPVAARKDMSRVVLKREGSDCSNHVLRPDDVRKLSTSKLLKMARESPFRWLRQDFVPALKHVGEWRVLIVGGRILYVVNTMENDEGNICADLRIAGYSLEEMRYALQSSSSFSQRNLLCKSDRMQRIPNYIQDDILERIGGSIEQRRHADEELHAFTLTTFKALVEKEGFGDSSLDLICRFDISVIENGSGTLDYFVNEVERGVAVCLFSSVDTDHVTERVADELGPLLVRWIRTRGRRLASRRGM